MAEKRTIHPSGVQYSSLVGDKLDPIEATALRFIHLFDQKLRKKGIRTLIGTEQEMFIQPEKNKTFAQLAEEEGIDLSEEMWRDFDPERQKLVNVGLSELSAPQAFAEHIGRTISEIYAPYIYHVNAQRLSNWERRKKAASKKGEPEPHQPILLDQSQIIEKFEYTARGNPGRMEIVNRPLSPVQAVCCHAANIRALYQASQEGQEENTKKGKDSGKTVRSIIKKGPKIGRVRFDPVGTGILAQEGTIYSQHLNISLHVPIADYGEAVNEETPITGHANLMAIAGYRIVLDKVLQAFTDKDLVVLMANPHSYSRLSRSHLRDDHHIEFLDLNTTKQHPDLYPDFYDEDKHFAAQMHSRVEFRIPDASSNPYLSTLLLMAASYYTTNILAHIGGSSKLPYAQRVAKGAHIYYQYATHRLSRQDSDNIDRILSETALARHYKNSIYAEESYQNMITSFEQHSLLLPMMREVAKTNSDYLECSELKKKILHHAEHNFMDPQKPEIGKPKHYYNIFER